MARPALHAWTEDGQPLRLIEQSVAKDDPDPKALACYGLLIEYIQESGQRKEEVWLRFVDGRPVSGVTTAFLEWSCDKLERIGKKALAFGIGQCVLACEQGSANVDKRAQPEGEAGREGRVRIIVCFLPIKSPWLNPIEPRWVHGKRKVVEAERLLTSQELADRVCEHFGCEHEAHLVIAEKVA